MSKYSQYFGVSDLLIKFAKNSPWFLRGLPIIGKHVYHWNQITEHLYNGCLMPVKVLSLDEGLVAGFTSLTAIGETPTPVIKVWKERLDLIKDNSAAEGKLYAASATFYRTDESWSRGCWSDVSPYVINCLVDDANACEKVRQRLKPMAWEALEQGLDLLPRFEEGLHHVDIPHDVAWNAY